MRLFAQKIHDDWCSFVDNIYLCIPNCKNNYKTLQLGSMQY